MGNDHYEPAVSRPPSSAFDDEGQRERERYVEEIRRKPGKSARRKALYDLWLGTCHAAVIADEASRSNLASTSGNPGEGGLRLWWDAVYSTSGLVRVLRRQANLLGLYIIWARYGDYAAEGLELVKEMAGEKDFLKPLFQGASWTDAGN